MAVLDFLVPVVREVGTFLLQRLGNAQSIEFKGRANLVTEMDRRSEDHLIRAIRAQHPDHAILSEEVGALAGAPGQPEWTRSMEPPIMCMACPTSASRWPCGMDHSCRLGWYILPMWTNCTRLSAAMEPS